MQKQGLQRFRSDLQNSGGMLHQLRFMALCHIPMPMPDRDVRFCAQIVQPKKLVVDEGLQRPYINAPHRGGRIFRKQCDDGEEGCLGFSGGSGSGKQQVFVRVENGIRCRHLNRPKIVPVIPVYKVLNKGGIPFKHTHRLPLTAQIPQIGHPWIPRSPGPGRR